MKNKLSWGIALLPFVPSVWMQGQEQKQGIGNRRPNIIFIMSDDHARQAMSIYGHPIGKIAPTPHIDRIGHEGAVFQNNYCCNSISGPSRAAILTGKHSHKNGFMRNGNKGFDGSQQTLPKILQANGYETTRHKGYVTDLITQYCEDWMSGREDKNKPFFLMMHHKAIHRNWVPAERHYHLYEHTQFPLPDNYYDAYEGRYAAQMQKMNIYRDMYEGHDLKMVAGMNSDSLLFDPWPHAFLGTMEPDERRRFMDAYRERNNEFYSKQRTFKEVAEWKYQRYLQDYMACVASVDESVGEILDYLKRTGLDKNTIVVYTTDQGFYLGEHGWFDKRQNIDFAPTFLDMCGIEIPEDMQGVSFRRLVEGENTPRNWRKSLYYHYYEFPGFHSVRAHYGVKMERYKLMHFYVDDKWELYDLKEDPAEMHNLYGEKGMEKVAAELKAELARLQEEYDVPESLCK